MCLVNEQEQKRSAPQETQKTLEKLERKEASYLPPAQIAGVSEASQKEAKRRAEQLSQLQSRTGFGAVRADSAAEGRAVQQLAPAKKTYKARKEEKRREREAKEKCPVGSVVTYDIIHQLADYDTQTQNSHDSYFASKSNQSGVDDRVLRFFSHGYRTDKAGNPATPDDEKYRLEDEAFYDAFCSVDYQRRLPYLQRMVDEALSLGLKADMFSDGSLRRNAARMKSIAGRIVSMQNVVNDEHNKFFIDKLPSEQREALDRILESGAAFSAAFTAECHQRGVDVKKNSYITDKDTIETYSGQEKDCVVRYQEKVNSFKQAGANRPDPETYQQIRSLLEADVQKILDCNVDELRAMGDKEIRQRREELSELYAACLKVDRFLTLEYPGGSRMQSVLTMREDLIGQRKLDYEYKSSLLRGLAERAAGFQRQGKRTIKTASALYRMRTTPGTAECQEFFKYFGEKYNPQRFVFTDSKFDDVAKELCEGKGKMAGPKARLMGKHYFSFDEEKRIRLGKQQTINEPLFRSPESFLKLEATHTLLTPEQYRKMLINLGAGGELLENPSKEQRDDAIKKNDAGLDTLREVMAAQYDMLERKYGDSIERLTIKDIMEHFADIARDFANIQVDHSMTKHFPGFIRENNPDDERLDNLIRYYNTCGSYVLDQCSLIGGGFIPAKEVSDECAHIKFDKVFEDLRDAEKIERIGQIQERMKHEDLDKIRMARGRRAYDELKELKEMENFRNLEKLRDAREALMGNSSFRHPTDWSQKVKKPIDT